LAAPRARTSSRSCTATRRSKCCVVSEGRPCAMAAVVARVMRAERWQGPAQGPAPRHAAAAAPRPLVHGHASLTQTWLSARPAARRQRRSRA
jgi:hypothetical protein